MWASFSAGKRGRTGEVSRTVEAGRGTEEKTPRPEGEGLLVWGSSLLLCIGRSVWVCSLFKLLLLGMVVVVVAIQDSGKSKTILPFSGVYLIYK